MAPRPTKTPPVPPLPDWATGAGKAAPTPTPTVPKTVTVPTTVPKPGAPGLPDWATGATTKPAGSTLPVQPVPRNVAQAELRGAQRDLAQATRAAERYGVPEQTVQEIVEQKEPNIGLKALGKVINFDIIPGSLSFRPVQTAVIKPLETLDVGRRAIVGALSPDVGIMEAIRNPYLSSKEAFNINTGNKYLDWTLGFTTDVLLDPVTYATFGTGGIVKSAATGLAREGTMVTTKAISRAAIKEAGELAVRNADDAARFAGQFLDDAERAAIRESAEAAAKESERLLAAAAPKAGTAGQTAVEAAKQAQRVGPRRLIGAKSREELAQIAREVRDVAVQSGNQYVARTLTDDVIGDLATRGYSAARGDVARALGLRGGIRWGVGKAKVILPGTERIADTFGQIATAIRVGAKTPLTDLPYLRNSLSFINKGFVGTRLGNAILRNTTPIGEGGLFGSEQILKMRTALRSGAYEGRKLTGQEANDFVRLLAQDNAYRGLKAAAATDAQQLLRGVYAMPGFQRYSNSVLDLLDNPAIGENLAAMTAADATAALGRTVDDAELALAKNLRKVGDEFYQRANYLYQRQQLMAGVQPDQLKELPKNKAWFPHTLSERARRALNNNKISDEILNELGVDRSFALAGSNLRQLKVGSIWFGRKLTQDDINGGVRRLNEIARPKLGYDFFETNAENAFNQYAAGWARDTSYTNFLYNMALATEVRRGLKDTPLGENATAFGAGLFAGKAFEGDVTQEAASIIRGVQAPKKLQAFSDAINDVLTPERMRALDNLPDVKASLQETADEIAGLRTAIEAKNIEGKLVFSDTLNQTLNDIEQRIFDLERLIPTGSLPAGYGASMSSEASALLQSLKNEADGLRLAINDVKPEMWANTVPIFLDSATRFLQVNAINYPGLVGSPQFTELIQNVRRLEDPVVARAMQNSIGRITQMFKGWVTATPGFHTRNALSNAFFMLSAGANLANVIEASRIYSAYRKFLKNQAPQILPADRRAREILMAPQEVFNNQTVVEFLASPEFTKLGLDPFVVSQSRFGTDITLGDLLTSAPPSGFGQIGDVFEQTGRLGVLGRRETGTGVLPSVSRGLGKPLGLSRDAGNFVETWSRFALLYDGIKQGLSPEQASQRVSKYLIDYQDLSRADQVIKQFIPFWMWTSRSFPLILESSWVNPRAYAIWNNFTRNIRDEEAQAGMVRPPYLLPAVPVGGNLLFNPDFGFQRQEEGFGNITDPRSLLASLTPVLRAPLEAGLNQEFRTGEELFSPYYDDPAKAQFLYVLRQLLPQAGALQRLGNVGVAGAQDPVTALTTLLGAGLGGYVAGPGGAVLGAGLGGGAGLAGQAAFGQVPAPAQSERLAQALQQIPGVGKPQYIEEEQGMLTPEESRQRLLSFLGLPFTQLQPWQQTAEIKRLIERLEQETTRAKEERERQRKRR